MFSIQNRDELPDVVTREFEQLAAAMGSAFLEEHNEDGTHINIPPIGSIVLWPEVVTPPDRWLVCDGRDVAQVDYPKLFKVIGVLFGSGAADAFTLPNLTPPTDTVYIIFAG